jgi:hypothetical protein
MKFPSREGLALQAVALAKAWGWFFGREANDHKVAWVQLLLVIYCVDLFN